MRKALLHQQQSYWESGERTERQPSGLSAEGRSEVSESTERESKARSKGFERPLKLRGRAARIPQKNRLRFCRRFMWNPAATYSPGPLPVKYHRH